MTEENFNLIEEFKKEHAVITDNFKKTKRLGVHLKEGQDVILSIQMNILSHLEKEDKELYPILTNTVKSERKVNDTLNVFDKNISAVSDKAIEFFDNYFTKAENQLARETE